MEEGASHLSWWSDVIALAASLVFAWPVVRTSFRLRKAEQTEAPAAKNAPRSDDVLSPASGQQLPRRCAHPCGAGRIIGSR